MTISVSQNNEYLDQKGTISLSGITSNARVSIVINTGARGNLKVLPEINLFPDSEGNASVNVGEYIRSLMEIEPPKYDRTNILSIPGAIWLGSVTAIELLNETAINTASTETFYIAPVANPIGIWAPDNMAVFDSEFPLLWCGGTGQQTLSCNGNVIANAIFSYPDEVRSVWINAKELLLRPFYRQFEINPSVGVSKSFSYVPMKSELVMYTENKNGGWLINPIYHISDKISTSVLKSISDNKLYGKTSSFEDSREYVTGYLNYIQSRQLRDSLTNGECYLFKSNVYEKMVINGDSFSFNKENEDVTSTKITLYPSLYKNYSGESIIGIGNVVVEFVVELSSEVIGANGGQITATVSSNDEDWTYTITSASNLISATRNGNIITIDIPVGSRTESRTHTIVITDSLGEEHFYNIEQSSGYGFRIVDSYLSNGYTPVLVIESNYIENIMNLSVDDDGYFCNNPDPLLEATCTAVEESGIPVSVTGTMIENNMSLSIMVSNTNTSTIISTTARITISVPSYLLESEALGCNVYVRCYANSEPWTDCLTYNNYADSVANGWASVVRYYSLGV